MIEESVHNSAMLSVDRRYRYYLHRVWNIDKPRLCWVMLNPSTADENTNDATIRVCMGRAALTGYGGIVVVNLFALRSTQPQGLYDLFIDPVDAKGESGTNDSVIRAAVQLPGTDVICAWGNHGAYLNRAAIIRGKLQEWGAVPKALKLNKDGSPAHPLRISYDTQPILY